MKHSRIAAAMVLGFAAVLLAKERKGTFALPDALKSSAPEIPADRNNLTRFFTAFPKFTPEIIKPLTKADERLEAGKDAGNPELLGKLLERHRQAKELLKPPLAFTLETEPAQTVALFGLFQEAGVLARQAMFEKDYAKADDLIEDMLGWSRMLRNARPNLMQAAISRSGWQKAFNALLLDWANHPDQSKRLAEIEQLHSKNRIDREELLETLKSEALWCARLGGLRKMLKDEKYADSATMFLKPPFNGLSAKDLLKLPYDAEADFHREMDETRGTLECLKNGTPMVSWPGFEIPVTGHTLEDYAKRPNGLGDLYREQMGSDTRNGVWSSALSRSPLLDTCLHWLKLERDGKPVDETGFTGFLDPVDGKPLTIDVKLRTIRSLGLNQKADPPDPEGGPMPAAGFFFSGDDFMIIVPRWRSGVSGEGNRAGGD